MKENQGIGAAGSSESYASAGSGTQPAQVWLEAEENPNMLSSSS